MENKKNRCDCSMPCTPPSNDKSSPVDWLVKNPCRHGGCKTPAENKDAQKFYIIASRIGWGLENSTDPPARPMPILICSDCLMYVKTEYVMHYSKMIYETIQLIGDVTRYDPGVGPATKSVVNNRVGSLLRSGLHGYIIQNYEDVFAKIPHIGHIKASFDSLTEHIKVTCKIFDRPTTRFTAAKFTMKREFTNVQWDSFGNHRHAKVNFEEIIDFVQDIFEYAFEEICLRGEYTYEEACKLVRDAIYTRITPENDTAYLELRGDGKYYRLDVPHIDKCGRVEVEAATVEGVLPQFYGKGTDIKRLVCGDVNHIKVKLSHVLEETNEFIEELRRLI